MTKNYSISVNGNPKKKTADDYKKELMNYYNSDQFRKDAIAQKQAGKELNSYLTQREEEYKNRTARLEALEQIKANRIAANSVTTKATVDSAVGLTLGLSKPVGNGTIVDATTVSTPSEKKNVVNNNILNLGATANTMKTIDNAVKDASDSANSSTMVDDIKKHNYAQMKSERPYYDSITDDEEADASRIADSWSTDWDSNIDSLYKDYVTTGNKNALEELKANNYQEFAVDGFANNVRTFADKYGMDISDAYDLITKYDDYTGYKDYYSNRELKGDVASAENDPTLMDYLDNYTDDNMVSRKWHNARVGASSVDGYGDYSGAIGGGFNAIGNDASAFFSNLWDSRADYMTNEQMAIYNYLYSNKGKDTADKYLDSLNLGEKESGYAEEYAKYEADTNPFLSSLYTVADTLAEPIALGQNVATYMSGNEINENVGFNKVTQNKNNVRSDVQSNITDSIENSNLNDTAKSILEKGATFLYNTGMSMADNLGQKVASGGNEAVMLALMGTSVAQNISLEKINEGEDTDRAFMYGLIAGGVEVLTEKVPIDNLWNMIKNKNVGTIKDTLKAYSKQFLAEGSEEIASDWLDEIADAMVNGDYSEFHKAYEEYLAQGMSEGDAFSKAIATRMKETAIGNIESFLSGGLSGIGLAEVSNLAHGGQSITRSIANEYNMSRTAKNVTKTGNADSILQAAQNSEEGSRVKALADQVASAQTENGNAKVDTKTARKIINAAVEEGNADVIKVANASNSLTYVAKETAKANKSGSRKAGIVVADNGTDLSNIGTIKEGENGSYTFTDTNTGKEMSSNAVAFSTQNTAYAFSHAFNFDDVTKANNYISAYKMSSGMTANSFRQAYNRVVNEITSGVNDVATTDAYYESTLQKMGLSKDSYDLIKTYALGVKEANKVKYAEQGTPLLKALSSATSTNVEYGGEEFQAGNVNASANGYYDFKKDDDGNVIVNAIRISDNTNQPVVVTFSHEIVHNMKQTDNESYKDWVNDTVGWLKQNASDDYYRIEKNVRELYKNDVEKWKADGLTEEEIQDNIDEEIAAQSTEAVVQKIGEMSDDEFKGYVKEHRTFFEKLISALKDFLAKFREHIKGYKATSESAKVLLRDAEHMQYLVDRYADLIEKMGTEAEGSFTDKSTNLSKTESELLNAVLNDDNSTIQKYTGEMYSEEDISEASTDRYSYKRDEELSDAAEKYNNGKDGGKVDALTLVRAKTVRTLIKRELSKVLQYLPEDNEGNIVVNNGSYSKTVENSLICVRSLVSNYFCDEVAKKVGRPLTVEEQLVVSQVLAEITGDQTECSYCYVATDRRTYKAFFNDYYDMYQKLYDDVVANKEAYKKDKNYGYDAFLNKRKPTKPMQTRYNKIVEDALAGKHSLEREYLTTAGVRSDYKGNTATGWFVNDAEKYCKSAAWPKNTDRTVKIKGVSRKLEYVAYNGNILKWKPELIKALNSEYGLRMYSDSDYVPAFLLENMQVVTDASVRGLKMLAYTKDVGFARVFAPTGMGINISVFGSLDDSYKNDEELNTARAKYQETKTDEDRKAYLKILDKYVIKDGIGGVNGMMSANWDDAVKLRDEYTYTNKDGNKTGNVGLVFVATNDDLVEWALANDSIDVVIPYHLVRTGTEVASFYGYKNYKAQQEDKKTKEWDSKKGDIKSIPPTMHGNDKAMYEEALKKNHLTARFSDYWDNPNYMKLVNETRMAYTESRPVQPIFDMESAKEEIARIPREGAYGLLKGTNSVEEQQRILNDKEDKAVEKVKSLGTVMHSLKDSTGADLTEDQAEFFIDSKARDKDGNLLVLYHGSHSGFGFTVFDRDMSDDGRSFFFTNNRRVAEGYAESKKVYRTASSYSLDELKNIVRGSNLGIINDNGVYSLVEYKAGYFGDKIDSTEFKGNFDEIRDYIIENYTELGSASYYSNGGIYPVYLNLENPLIVDADNTQWDSLPSLDGSKGYWTTRDYSEYADKNGYDGVIFNNIYDDAQGLDHSQSVYIAFDPSKIKLTANEHPSDSNDIRYSLKAESTDADFEEVYSLAEDRQLERAIKTVVKEYNADADIDALSNQLAEAYKIRKEDEQREFIRNNIAYDIVSNAMMDIPATNEAVVDYIKPMSITLTEEQTKEIKHTYGSIKEFRDRLMHFGIKGISTKEGGSSLNSIWDEMVEKSGNVSELAEATSDVEQPIALLEYLEKTGKSSEKAFSPSEYAEYQDAVTDEITQELLEIKKKKIIGTSLADIVAQGMQGKVKPISEESTRDIAIRILSAENSNYDVDDFAKDLSNVFTYLQTKNGRLNYKDLIRLTYDLAKPVIDLSSKTGDKRTRAFNVALDVYKQYFNKVGKVKTSDEIGKAIERVSERYDRKIENIRKRKEITELRKKIRNKKDRLDRMLKHPTKGSHIPEELLSLALNVAKSIDTTSRDRLSWMQMDRVEELKKTYAKLEEEYASLIEKNKKEDTFFKYDEGLQTLIKDFKNAVEGNHLTDLTIDELTTVNSILNSILVQTSNINKFVTKGYDMAIQDTSIRGFDEVMATKGTNKKNPFARWWNGYQSVALNFERMANDIFAYNTGSVGSLLTDIMQGGEIKYLTTVQQGEDIFSDVLGDRHKIYDLQGKGKLGRMYDTDKWVYLPGTDIKVTKAMRLSLIMHLRNTSNLRHIAFGGFKLPDLHELKYGHITKAYENGTVFIPEFINDEDVKFAKEKIMELEVINDETGELSDNTSNELYKAYAEAVKRREANGNSKEKAEENAMLDEDIQLKWESFQKAKSDAHHYLERLLVERANEYADLLESDLTQYEIKWLNDAKDFFYDFSGSKINEVTRNLYGYNKASVENYFPIKVDPSSLNTESESVKMDGTIEGMGFLKERVISKKPILLLDITSVAVDHIEKTARFCGWAEAIRDTRNVLGQTFKRNGEFTSLRVGIAKKRLGMSDHFVKFVDDIENPHKSNAFDKVVNKLRSNFASATLTGNLGVMLKQFASFPTAIAEVGFKPVMKAFKYFAKSGVTRKGIEEIESRTPLLRYRESANEFSYEAGLMGSDKLKWFTGMISWMDVSTVRTLEYAAKYSVDDMLKEEGINRNDLTDDEYWNKVTDTFNNIVRRTQPNYTTLERPEVLRDTNSVFRALFMFATQPMQNYGILYDSINEFKVKADAYKNASEENKEFAKNEKNRAGKQMARAIVSNLLSDLVFTAITMASKVLFRNPGDWLKDDDDDGKKELQWDEIWKSFVTNFVSSEAGMFVGGSYLYDFLESVFTGDRYHGIQDSSVEMIGDFLDSSNSLKKAFVNYANAVTEANKEKYAKELTYKIKTFATNLASCFGVPVGNAYKIINSYFGLGLAKDIANGEMFSGGIIDNDTSDIESQTERIVDAYSNGNMDRYNALREQMIADGKDEDAVDKSIKTALNNAYKDGTITDEQMSQYLIDTADENNDDDESTEYTEDDAWKDLKRTKEGSVYKEYIDLIGSYASGNIVNISEFKKVAKEYLNHGIDKGDIGSAITKEYKEQYLSATGTDKKRLKQALINAYISIGYTTTEATKRIANWK